MSSKKIWSILTACVLVVGLLTMAAPALAQSTDVGDVQLFMPDGDEADKNQLSDAFDGTDSLAHFTAIADPDATQAEFFVCTPGGNIGTNACQLIGTDTAGNTAVPFANRDQAFVSATAFEVFYDIPANLDSFSGGTNTTYDIIVRACVGAPSTTNTANNCDEDREGPVSLDDSSTTTCGGPGQPACTGGEGQQLPTGEITGICSEVATNNFGANGEPTTTNPCQANEFQPFDHGDEIPGDDFTIRFTTSDDVTTAGACLGTNEGVNAQPQFEGTLNEPDGCDVQATNVFAGGEQNTGTTSEADDFKVWYATFSNPVGTEGTGSTAGDVDVAIFGATGLSADSTAECESDFAAGAGGPVGDVCVLDEHYAVAQQETAGSTNASFDLDSSDANGGNDDGCGPDEDDRNAVTNIVLDEPGNEYVWNDEEIEGCVTSQFGGAFTDLSATQRAVFELEGDAGSLRGTGDCDVFDRDADGQFEQAICDTATSSGETDEFDVRIEELYDADDNVVEGDATVTFCIDEEGTTPTNAQFGCADEAESDTVVKSYVGQAQNVALVFQDDDATTSDADNCATGDQFRTNTEGDTDTLLVCTYDNDGDLVAVNYAHSFDNYDDTGNDNAGDRASGELSWTNTNPTAVAFTQNPPTGTDDGTTTVGIRAANAGSATITVTLSYYTGNSVQDSNGNWVAEIDTASASVTKSVQEGTGQQPQCNDGVDNDGDGQVDFGQDPGCSDVNDNTENTEDTNPDPTVTTHDRTIKITRFRHVDIGKARPALLIKGRVTSPDFESCAQAVPVKVQIRAGGEWITRKSDTTNDRGVFKILIRHVHAKYRAVATRYQIEDLDNNNVDVCRRARHARRYRH